MFKDFPAFVPSKVCLACDGCCRFRDENSAWRPRSAESERAQITPPRTDGKKTSLPAVASDGRLAALPYGGSHICIFLDPRHNTCGIYPVRPFECQLYPFLLARSNGRPAVLLHLLCPYAQDAWGKDRIQGYLGTLRDFLGRDEIQRFLGRNRELFGDYAAFTAEWELLFYLDLKDETNP